MATFLKPSLGWRSPSDNERRDHDVDAGDAGAEAGREPTGEQRVLSSGLHIAQRPQKNAAVVGGRAAPQSMCGRRRVDRHVHDVQRHEVGARLEYPIDGSTVLGQCPGLVEDLEQTARAERSRMSAVARSAMSSGSSASAARIAARPSRA